ncbi:hypothetical protein [Pseudomonas sp. CF161]|nr:hypothetical protein [Pseudomonas sp. CF161]EPL03914.1 hypothetical protein CF161_28885 [Pseudomonas sp. CF161]
MNEVLVQQLLAKARKSLAAGDKLQAAAWHNLAKSARGADHRI